MIALSSLDEAKDLSGLLRSWRNRREFVDSGKFGLTIQSAYQTDEMVEAVRPAALAFIDSKIDDICAQLKKLGVDTSA